MNNDYMGTPGSSAGQPGFPASGPMAPYDRQTADSENSGIGTALTYNLFMDAPDTASQGTFKTPTPPPTGPANPFDSIPNYSVVAKNDG